MIQTCLIAAHDPWFIQLLRIFAEETGFQVIQAFEGEDILPILYQQKPAVILLQFDLPGTIRSSDVIQSIKMDPVVNTIPVLVFSWQGEKNGELEGAAARLQEPITYENFLEALEEAGVYCNEKAKSNGTDLADDDGRQVASSRRSKGRKKKGPAI